MRHWLIGALIALYATTSPADDFAHQATHRPVRVFDANGHVIGDLTIFAAQNGVALTAGDATAVIPIARVQDATFHFSATDFNWLATKVVDFASPDCSGDPILDSLNGPRAALAVRRGNDVTVYFAAEGVTQSFQANSALDPNAANGCRPFTASITLSGFKVGATLTISRTHPEPLRIGY
ncbi:MULTISPECIES: hypothetical protein [Caballeronia]|uniref:hypothetical protein n=1 Tax=Caballeronia TaxID=1827195 RepID=UPI00158B7B44|nr:MULTISPECIES: hypothetical protein [Caballeronia]MCG7404002.1 hypothetical protein [Caballeronia zhejiangensis]MCI1045429.1 hypothetical protein [Caballeronia zhejiangensis]